MHSSHTRLLKVPNLEHTLLQFAPSIGIQKPQVSTVRMTKPSAADLQSSGSIKGQDARHFNETVLRLDEIDQQTF